MRASVSKFSPKYPEHRERFAVAALERWIFLPERGMESISSTINFLLENGDVAYRKVDRTRREALIV